MPADLKAVPDATPSSPPSSLPSFSDVIGLFQPVIQAAIASNNAAPAPASAATTPASQDKGLYALVLFVVSMAAAAIAKKWGFTIDSEWITGLIVSNLGYMISHKAGKAYITVAETKADTERRNIQAASAVSPEAAIEAMSKMLAAAREHSQTPAAPSGEPGKVIEPAVITP